MPGKRSGIEQLKNNYIKTLDYWIIIPIVSISLIGLFVLNKVLSEGFVGYPQILYRQAGAAMIGIVIALSICLIETHFLKIIGWAIYVGSTFLLLMVPFDGFSLHDQWGADSWMKLPVIGTFQPSEFAKLGLIIVVAFILEDMALEKISLAKGVRSIIMVYAPPVLLIANQPDFGTLTVILFTLVCVLYVWGVKYRYFFLALSLVVMAIPFVWNFYFASFQKKRILSAWFRGADIEAEYNLVQAQKAIASGGLVGNKTGNLVRVPVKESDFIYTAVSEHLGFIGTTALLLLAFFFLGRCLFVAASSPSKAHSFIVTGITAGFAFHFIENMGMTVGLLPITGIPLPFVSLGGTALLINFVSIGVLLSISMVRKQSFT